MKFYGKGIPGVNADELTGKLIVIEGADGSGRSTQIRLLTEWLEGRGKAVVDVGLKRSNLVSAELEEAMKGNILSPLTMSLFYATDFADQMENRIIPALKAGFIVLADRYIYTLMSRDIVRGGNPDWLRGIYEQIAIVPDVVFYLDVAPRYLIERNLNKNKTLDYWESGMDIRLSRDIFDSFIKYQRKIRLIFHDLSKRYGFQTVNGNRRPKVIAADLQRRIEKIL
ncbi:MAG: thymidylate kinase [candidate division KSB1 bacterium]|nr:thymidylate kinase [candidate division KSB1 bacterium]